MDTGESASIKKGLHIFFFMFRIRLPYTVVHKLVEHHQTTGCVHNLEEVSVLYLLDICKV